jgi:3-isopropylmalate/(R)-2-methylmalate dehydratase small subunit
VWAIAQYGFKTIIAPYQESENGRIPAFADIFRNNCVKNSLLTIELAPSEVEQIFSAIQKEKGATATIDLESQKVSLHTKNPLHFSFSVDPAVKKRLLHGLDDIGLTLEHADKIKAFESKHNVQITPARV